MARRLLGWYAVAVNILAALFVAQVASAEPSRETYYQLVFADAAPGQDEAFNRWYVESHVPMVLRSSPAYVSAQRFELAENQLRPPLPPRPRYLTIYTLRTTHLPEIYGRPPASRPGGNTTLSPTMNQASLQSYAYRAIGAAIPGSANQPAGAKPGAMETYLQMVFADEHPTEDPAFNTWFQNVHSPEVASVPGFVGAQRFVYNDLQIRAMPAPKYLAVYTIQTSDIAAVWKAFLARAPIMSMSPLMRPGHVFGYTYRAISPVINAADLRRTPPGK